MYQPTESLERTASNPVPWLYIVSRSKALNKCIIQHGVCSTTQCWWEGSSTCSKPCSRSSCKDITWSTDGGGYWSVYQSTLTASVHSPDGDSSHVPSNSTYEGEVMTRTGGGSCSELSSNITWRKISLNGIVFSSAALVLQLETSLCRTIRCT